MGEERIDPADWDATIADADGPQLVVGGPGTGKTEFLVRRATHLIDSGVATPDEVLLLSFSRRGSAGLRSRIQDSLTDTHAELDASTFHSFSFRLLETYAADALGWQQMPTLLTSLEYVLRVRALLSSGDETDWPVLFRGLLDTTTFAEEVADFMLRCSELLIGSEDLAGFNRDDWRALPSFMTRYRAETLADHRIDYGTLQASAVAALDDEATLAEVAERYRYVLVDEYQDTTLAQAALLRRLVSGGSHLTVAADPYQSIYSFRGADLENVATFPEAFAAPDGTPAARRVLTTSFRAPAEILDAAVKLTEGLELPGASGPVIPADGTGSVETYVFDQATREAEWIADEIQLLHSGGLPYRSMAVFVRSKRRFLPGLSRALERRGIPHAQPDSRLSDHPAVRAVFDCVTAATASGPESSLAVRRLLLGPLFRLPIGRLRELERDRARDPRPWADIIEQSVADGSPLANLLRAPEWAENRPAVDGFWHLWQSLPQFVHLVVDPNRSEERAAWSSFSQVLGRLYDRDRSASLCDFVRWSEEESFEAQPLLDFRDQGVDRVTVTTLHQSKGLEFDVVFIADAVDGVFPDLRSRESLIGTRHLAAHLPTAPNEYRRFRLQEETRLAYTAMTRARLRVVWTATTAGLDEGEGAPSPLLVRLAPADPGPPADDDRLPVTTGQAEAWLRRMAADPSIPEPRRLAAMHSLAAGTDWQLREPTLFAGLHPPGPDTGLAPDELLLSPSQAGLYETCPRRYAIERRLRVGADPTVYLAFGSLIHKVLELTEKNAIEDGRTHGTTAEALEQLELQWDPAPFGGRPWADAWKRRGKEALAFAYEHWPHPGATPIALEHKLTLDVDGVSWRGIADRIEAEDGHVRIVDYKTSRSRPNAEETAASLQLGFYLLAAAADPDITGHGSPDAGELWMVAMQNVKSFPVVTFDPANLGDVEQRLRDVAAGIAGERWEAAPHDRCDRCPVQLVCPAWPQGAKAYQS
ncbi:MAG: ATP-dependent helicase [Acidimicrobiia bacterium]|nr:ATP-dependent helicase [Acidimicrobiia bacterium]